jgi:hypothetical protein
VRLASAFAAATVLAAAAPSIAAAQARSAVGSIIPTPRAATMPDSPSLKTNDATAVMLAFGKCAAKDEQGAERLLASVPDTKDAWRTVAWLAQTSGCLNNGQLRFKPILMRGPVAEYLFERMRLAPAKYWARKKIFEAPDSLTLASVNPAERAEVALILFGQCVGTKDMSSVKALLATRPNTPDETAAFAKLSPAFGSCAEKDVSLKLNRFQLRGYLAEGAYRAMVIQSKDSGRAQG